MRAPTVDDVSSLHRLIRWCEAADNFPFVTTVDEVKEYLTEPGVDPEHDLVVVDGVIDGEPGVVGWGRVSHHRSGMRLERAILDGAVHPDHRRQGLGARILRWQVERATELLAATDEQLPAYIVASGYESEVGRLALFEQGGLDAVRWSDELERDLPADLDEELADVGSPDGITIRPWDAADNEAARLVSNASFADHWGSTPKSEETWSAMLTGHGARLDLSFVAVDDETDELVGISLNGHYPDDAELWGRLDGWIDHLGTLRSHRKRGIGSALVAASLRRFSAEGFGGAMLGVDAENPSGAYAIYQRLGFRPRYRTVIVRRTVREGSDGVR